MDPRPFARGSLRDVFRQYPHLGAVLPALGYSPAQQEELRETIEATPCDAVLHLAAVIPPEADEEPDPGMLRSSPQVSFT